MHHPSDSEATSSADLQKKFMDDDPRATQVGMFPHGGDAVVRLALSKASLGRVARDKSRMHIRARVPCERQYGHAYSVRPIVHLLPWHATYTSIRSLWRSEGGIDVCDYLYVLSGRPLGPSRRVGPPLDACANH